MIAGTLIWAHEEQKKGGRIMRVLLVDDHPLFRHGLLDLLRDLDANAVIAEAGDCEEAIRLASPDFELVLLDLHMPGLAGVDALDAIRGAFESARVVVLSGDDDPRQVRQAIDRGAAGYITKSSTPKLLLNALRLVLAGGVYLPPVALRGLPESAKRDAAQTTTVISRLTERQQDVLRRAVSGKSNKAIARDLGLSEGTIKAHLSSIFRAIGVSNRTEAVCRLAKIDAETTRLP